MDLGVTWVEIFVANQVWMPLAWMIFAALSFIVLMTAMPMRRRRTSTQSAAGTAPPTATAKAKSKAKAKAKSTARTPRATTSAEEETVAPEQESSEEEAHGSGAQRSAEFAAKARSKKPTPRREAVTLIQCSQQGHELKVGRNHRAVVKCEQCGQHATWFPDEIEPDCQILPPATSLMLMRRWRDLAR